MASAATATQPQGAASNAYDLPGLAKNPWGQQVRNIRCVSSTLPKFGEPALIRTHTCTEIGLGRSLLH